MHLNPVSEESIGAGVLAKVTDGEADAGLVYLNDAHKAGDSVDTVRFPESADAVNIYPIVALKKASQSGAGAEVRRPGDRRDGPTGAESGRLRQSLNRAKARPVDAPGRLGVSELSPATAHKW